MSFSLKTFVPHSTEVGELQLGAPGIVDGLKWQLAAKLQKDLGVIDVHVECSSYNKSTHFARNVSITYQTVRPSSSDELVVEKLNNGTFKSKSRRFLTNEFIAITDVGYIVGVTVNIHQSKTFDDLANEIVELKKINEENLSKIDGKYEQKCAKLEETIRELEEKLKEKNEVDGLAEQTDMLKISSNRDEKLKSMDSKLDAGMLELEKMEEERKAFTKCFENLRDSILVPIAGPKPMEIDYQMLPQAEQKKRRLEQKCEELEMMQKTRKVEDGAKPMEMDTQMFHQKLTTSDKKIELLQKVVIETEADMTDLKQKNEKLKLEVEDLAKLLAMEGQKANEADDQVEALKSKVGQMQKELVMVISDKSARIAILEDELKEYEEGAKLMEQGLLEKEQMMEQMRMKEGSGEIELRLKNEKLFGEHLQINCRMLAKKNEDLEEKVKQLEQLKTVYEHSEVGRLVKEVEMLKLGLAERDMKIRLLQGSNDEKDGRLKEFARKAEVPSGRYNMDQLNEQVEQLHMMHEQLSERLQHGPPNAPPKAEKKKKEFRF